MSELTEPDSAISSWSGFVYQGKVALYHCLKLITEGEREFELQLDSTDDFAIYKDGKLFSAHQVKAKVGSTRGCYTKALKKSAEIDDHRKAGTKRYFHVSVKIDDTSDYTPGNGETVSFYKYNDQKYCELGQIEGITKDLIKTIFNDAKGFPPSERLTDQNYCLISESISSKAIEIHKINQIDGAPENKAAFENRINASKLLAALLSEGLQNDVEYFATELRKNLFNYLEKTLDDLLPEINDKQYLRAQDLFKHLHDLNSEDLQRLCQVMKPSESFSKIQHEDIGRYSELIQDFCIDPILQRLPHYMDSESSFYLPTALTLLSDRECRACVDRIREEMKNNRRLQPILFEYRNLIAFSALNSFRVETKITENDGSDPKYEAENQDNKITRELSINVITKLDAEGKLNA
ncbi:TPA: ABC-three component system protein [Pseudomonas aeruginosa]